MIYREKETKILMNVVAYLSSLYHPQSASPSKRLLLSTIPQKLPGQGGVPSTAVWFGLAALMHAANVTCASGPTITGAVNE